MLLWFDVKFCSYNILIRHPKSKNVIVLEATGYLAYDRTIYGHSSAKRKWWWS
jgi:hypothetical protein